MFEKNLRTLKKKFYTKDDNHFSHTRNHPSKMNLFWCYEFFSELSISKKKCKNQFENNNNKYAADPEKGFPT